MHDRGRDILVDRNELNRRARIGTLPHNLNHDSDTHQISVTQQRE
jgi:hypothetical protein